MKKVNLILGTILISSLFVFTGCEEETYNSPDITFTNNINETTLDPGVTSWTVSGTITSEAGLDQVVFFYVNDDGDETQEELVDDFPDNTSWTFSHTVTSISDNLKVKVSATDKENQTSAKVFTINFTPGGEAIDEFTAILLGAQKTSDPSCLDLHTGDTYHISDNEAADNSSVIDLLYYYGSSNNATFAAPDDATVNGGSGDFNWTGGDEWSTTNSTKFGVSSVTAAEFDAMEDDLVIQDISGLSASKLTNLSVDDVLSFEAADGKKGLIKVTNLQTGGDGSITIEVKIQQ